MPYADPEKKKANYLAYGAAHREERRAYARAWRARNRARHRALSKAWDAAHSEHVRQRKAAWARAHPESGRAWHDAHYAANRTAVIARNEAWRKAHPEINAMMASRRRARIAGAPVNDFTAAQWQAMKEHYQHCCAYCGRKLQRLTQDHLTPLSKGGSHTYSNIVPACLSCNSKKGTRAPFAPVQPLLCL